MGSTQERDILIGDIFHEYDTEQSGELHPKQLQTIHSDMRIGGISIPQIQEAIKYVCIGNACEKTELFDLLQEMDRRYFLIQDFRWEFSMLDCNHTDTISEEQAKWFVQMVHGKFFSNLRWEKFLRSRAVPGSGVCFGEIEVMLCNIPSKEDYLADLEEERREQEDLDKTEQELNRKIEEEKERRRQEREESEKQREEEEIKKKLLENKRKKEEEDERAQKQKEKEEAERMRKELEDEEERGRREAEEEKAKKEKELAEAQRFLEQQERHRQEEEARRRMELEEVGDLEKLLEDVKRREREAEQEAENENKRHKNAKDEATKKDAKEKEDRARLKSKDYRNKRLRLQLKVGIKKHDHERLPKAMEDFKRAKLPDDDADLPKGDRILREYEARNGLKKAISGRQIQPLEKAIAYVKQHGFEMQLSHELIEANKILLQLRRLERIRAEILELKQSTVAEIRSYQKPPTVVHVVMTGTFLILGHKEKETKDWKTVQALVGKTGKDGLKRRCLGCEPNMIIPQAASRAKELLSQFDLEEVRDVSAGAATFFVWSWTMIEELESLQAAKKAEEEDKRNKEMKKEEKASEIEKIEAQKCMTQESKQQEGNSNAEQVPQVLLEKTDKQNASHKRSTDVHRGKIEGSLV